VKKRETERRCVKMARSEGVKMRRCEDERV
jgi:hypothetical protein